MLHVSVASKHPHAFQYTISKSESNAYMF
jgi:hypothetical protein